jgi:hypothetical protein
MQGKQRSGRRIAGEYTNLFRSFQASLAILRWQPQRRHSATKFAVALQRHSALS